MRIKLEKNHLQWGLTAFLVILCSVLAFFFLYKFQTISRGFDIVVGVMTPIIIGLVMGYLLCPVYNAAVGNAYALFNRGKYKFRHDLTISKVIGTIVSVLIIFVVIGGVVWMILPGLIDSIGKVIYMLPSGMERFAEWVDSTFKNLPPAAKETIDDAVDNAAAYMIDYASNTILPKSGSMVAYVSGTIIGAVGLLTNFFIGIIICIYFLNIKETLAAQVKKIILAYCSEERASEILKGATFANKTFSGFISGKIIDSIIIGILCFVVMTLFGWEYSLLISCIVGITNIIPFFGPFIGAIPSTMLLLMVSPMHALYFIIFIILLQQFDGNILGPKILGDSTGLPSFWVLFAVLVGGGLFGFKGMILGIPVFAVLCACFTFALNSRLESKGYSTDTLDYKVDRYRNYRSKKKRNKAKAESRPAAEAGSAAESRPVQEATEDELKKAEEKGHQIMEATVVEYEDEQETGNDRENIGSDKE